MTFAIGSLVGLTGWLFKRPSRSTFSQPAKVWFIGIARPVRLSFLLTTQPCEMPQLPRQALSPHRGPCSSCCSPRCCPMKNSDGFMQPVPCWVFVGTLLLLTSRDETGVQVQAVFSVLVQHSCAPSSGRDIRFFPAVSKMSQPTLSSFTALRLRYYRCCAHEILEETSMAQSR